LVSDKPVVFLAGGRVPDASRLIVGGRDEQPAVRAKGGRGHSPLMTLQKEERLQRRRVPDAAVSKGQHQRSPTIGTEHGEVGSRACTALAWIVEVAQLSTRRGV